MLKISDLKGILNHHGIPQGDYSLDAASPPMVEVVVCIRPRGDGYEVYISERNVKEDCRLFAHEDAACRYFLELFGIQE